MLLWMTNCCAMEEGASQISLCVDCITTVKTSYSEMNVLYQESEVALKYSFKCLHIKAVLHHL